jgi:hypothetical protein
VPPPQHNAASNSATTQLSPLNPPRPGSLTSMQRNIKAHLPVRHSTACGVQRRTRT